MVIGFVSQDLMIASKIKQLVTPLGITVEFQGKGDSSASWKAIPALIIVDLQTPGCDPEAWYSALRAKFSDATLLAYAGHTLVDRLSAARAAGFDQVITRGQLESRVHELASSMTQQ